MGRRPRRMTLKTGVKWLPHRPARNCTSNFALQLSFPQFYYVLIDAMRKKKCLLHFDTIFGHPNFDSKIEADNLRQTPFLRNLTTNHTDRQ